MGETAALVPVHLTKPSYNPLMRRRWKALVVVGAVALLGLALSCGRPLTYVIFTVPDGYSGWLLVREDKQGTKLMEGQQNSVEFDATGVAKIDSFALIHYGVNERFRFKSGTPIEYASLPHERPSQPIFVIDRGLGYFDGGPETLRFFVGTMNEHRATYKERP
jgi:hypothetical protein